MDAKESAADDEASVTHLRMKDDSSGGGFCDEEEEKGGGGGLLGHRHRNKKET